MRVIDARQNIRQILCGHVIRVSYGQSDFWGPTKVERSYPSAIMSRLSPTESDVAKWPQTESLILLAKCHRSSPHFRIALSHSYHSLSLARRKRHKAKPKITIYTTSIIYHSPSLNQTLETKVLYQLTHLFTVLCAPLCLPPSRRKNPGCQSCATSWTPVANALHSKPAHIPAPLAAALHPWAAKRSVKQPRLWLLFPRFYP